MKQRVTIIDSLSECTVAFTSVADCYLCLTPPILTAALFDRSPGICHRQLFLADLLLKYHEFTAFIIHHDACQKTPDSRRYECVN